MTPEQEHLSSLVKRCTEKQQAFFKMLYGSAGKIPDKYVPGITAQVERTIKENS